MSILTVAHVQRWVPQAQGDEALVSDAIEMAEGLAEEACGRKLISAERTEYFSCGDGQTALALSAYPVTAIALVQDGADTTEPSTVLAADYTVQSDAGLLHRYESAWPAGVQNVSVKYTGGYTAATCPAGLKQVLAQIVAWVLEHRGNVGAVNDATDGHSVTFDDMSGVLPKRLSAALSPWKAVRLG